MTEADYELAVTVRVYGPGSAGDAADALMDYRSTFDLPMDGEVEIIDARPAIGEEAGMRRFTVYRISPPEGYLEDGHANPPDEVQFEGVVFTDGTVCVRWRTRFRSHSLWASMDELLAVHGHEEYDSRIEWLDP